MSFIIEYLRSINKTSKIIFLISTPLILSLLAGGIFLEIHMLINGYSNVLNTLCDELILCCGECIARIYIPALIIDFIKRN